ncbi:MAG: hypothetical protein E6Z83_14515 [Pantoea sp.]|uniref:hypothetical protein n=1 Tax=Pantoea TaxID=53335 RepID=UPI000A1146AF|nr:MULTISPECIES: hypothetical protein [Pantoea]MDU5782000.1 hypothetical protein [Pantoea sp.]
MQAVLLGTETSERQSVLSGLSDLWEVKKNPYAVSAVVYREFVRFSVSVPLNVLMWQGLVEEAALASRRMQRNYPQTYFRVSPQNLNMVYFLVENQLEPYIRYINSNPVICKGIGNELCKILSK